MAVATCRKGHPRTTENDRINRRGYHVCRACQREAYDRNYRSNRLSPHVAPGPKPPAAGGCHA